MKMQSQQCDFATVTKNGVITTIGKSFIMTPKPQCRENSIKWFDDTKLLRRCSL